MCISFKVASRIAQCNSKLLTFERKGIQIFDHVQVERAGSRGATEASRSAPGFSWSTAERMGCGGMWSYALRLKTGGGAEVGPMLPGDCPRPRRSLRSDR